MAVTIPGMLHLVHNSLTEVAKHMGYWPAFWAKLKQFQLLWTEGRRET